MITVTSIKLLLVLTHKLKQRVREKERELLNKPAAIDLLGIDIFVSRVMATLISQILYFLLNRIKTKSTSTKQSEL